MDTSTLPVLPPRPLTLDTAVRARRRRSALQGSAVSGVVILLSLGCALYFGSDAWQARQLWRAGTAGEVQDYSGEVSTTEKLGIPLAHSYDLDVTFVDAQGQQHTGHRSFTYALTSAASQEENPGVRYDPADPSRFVLSWEAQGLKPWSLTLIALVFGLGFVVAEVRSARRAKERRQLEDLCAQEGEELLLEQLGFTQAQGSCLVKVRLPDGTAREETLPTAPLTVERDGKTYAVALQTRSAPGKYLLVESSYAPFVAPAASAPPRAEPLAATGS